MANWLTDSAALQYDGVHSVRFLCRVGAMAMNLEAVVVPESSVGGTEAMHRALRLLTSARDGHGCLLLLTGEAGIGKTWLAERLTESASANKVTTCWAVNGRGGAPPLWPWLQLLRQLVDGTELLGNHPHVEQLLAGNPPGFEGETRDLLLRFALFDDLMSLLSERSRISPLFLVIDDLHEADPATLLLMQLVAPLLRRIPVIIVATMRDQVVTDFPEWPSVQSELRRNGEVVPVEPLQAKDISTLLESAARIPANPEIVRQIERRTGGNAMFVCELVRLVTKDEAVVPAAGGLPETVRAAVAGRLAKQSAACRNVLALASVFGPYFSVEDLADVLEEPTTDLLGHLDEAVVSGLIARSDDRGLSFGHEIIRDAVYEALPQANRLYWHREIAIRIEQKARVSAAVIAHHYLLAGNEHRTEAAAWSERAGHESLSMLAYEDAARHFGDALKALEREPESAKLHGRIRLCHGDALLAAGNWVGAREAHLAALAIARSERDGALLAAAALGLGAGRVGFEVTILDHEQITALEEALELLPEEQRATRAAVLARLSVALTFTGAEERRARLADESVELARRCSSDATLAAALSSECDVLAGPEHNSARLALATEVVEIAARLRDSPLELLGRRQRLIARLELGDLAGVDEEVRGYQRIARPLRQPLYSWYLPLWQAMSALMEGRIDNCREHITEAQRLGDQSGSVNAVALIATLRWCLAGELAGAEEIGAFSHEFNLDDVEGPWVPVTQALASAQLGDHAEARRRLDAAQLLLPALPRDSEWLPTVCQVAEAVSIVGAHPVADWAYYELLPFAHLFAVEGIGAVMRGSVQRHLGILAAALGHRDDAAEHFAAANVANVRLGGTLLVARTLYDAGVSLADKSMLADSRTRYLAIGAQHRVAAIDSIIGEATKVDQAVFRKEGAMWALAFGGKQVIMRDSKGLRDLALLIASPGRPHAAVDLASGGVRGSSGGTGNSSGTDGLHEQGDLGEVVDHRARESYRRRLAELDDEEAEADERGDAERSARLAAEREAIVAELSAAYGLAGRPRRAGSPVERARTTVTARIRDSIRHVEAVHPELGHHLRRSVHTGTVCVYEPETAFRWSM